MRDDGRCVIETGDRTIAVRIDALSGHDRDYAERAAVRLASRRGTSPATNDTAGL